MKIINTKNIQIPVNNNFSNTKKSNEVNFLKTKDQISIGNNKPNENPLKINILHLNDIHGAVEPIQDPKISKDSDVGGIANAKTVIDNKRAENPDGTLLLNAGDLAEGSMISYLTKGKVMADTLKEFKFDAVELGNHDFAWGQDNLNTLVEGLDAPVLGANIVNPETGKPINGIKPYTIKNVKGVNIGIIGVDTTDTVKYIDKEQLKGIKFEDTSKTIEKYLPEVKEKGADVVVLLSHVGNDMDKKIAEKFGDEIDVIVGGHSHTVLPKGEKIGNTTIVQAGTNFEYVGDLELDIDPKTKKVINSKAQLIPVIDKDIKPDPEIESILKPYLDQTEKIGSKVMGKAKEDLPFEHKSAAILNQIHADSMMKKTGADICVTSSRNLRGNVKSGDVTYKQLYSAFPMTEEDVTTMKTTGHKVKEEIERRLKDGGRGIVIPGGFKYEYNPSLPNGERITSITMPDGKPMDLDKEYNVVTTTSMTKKEAFKDAKDTQNHGSSQELFFDYFSENSPWNNSADDRVKVSS